MNYFTWSARSVLLTVAIGVASCGGDKSPGPVGPVGGTPTSLTVVSGDAQQGQAGDPLPAPLVVKVVDATGKPTVGTIVSFKITIGDGTLSAATANTDANGQASVTWTMGSGLGDSRVEARVVGITAVAAFTTTVKAGKPTLLQRTSDATGSAAGGFELPDSFAVKLTDRFGNGIAGTTVTFSVTSGGGRVSSTSKLTNTDGVARTAWTLGTTGTQTLAVSSADLAGSFIVTAVACPEATLAVGQVTTITAGNAQCLVLNGAAQRYIVSVVNPTNSPIATASFRFRGAGGGALTSTTELATSSDRLTTSLSQLPLSAGDELQESAQQQRVHERILQASYDVMRRLGKPAVAESRFNGQASMQAMPLPNVGDVIDMKVPKNFGDLCDARVSSSSSIGAARVRGRVLYVGTRSIVVEDSSNVASGTFDAMYRSIGQEFDNTVWNIETTYFGNPLAMDARLQNTGRIFMLFSNTVNVLQGGNVAGFVSSGDFYPTTSTDPSQACAASNQESVFYARVPTSTEQGFPFTTGKQTGDEWYRSIRTVIPHEVKHVTSFAEKLSRTGSIPAGFFSKDQWLEESSAMLAEELWARTIFGYGQRGNIDYDASLYCEVRPNPLAAYAQTTKWQQKCAPGKPLSLFDHFIYSYDFASNPEGLSIVGPVSSTDATFYGIGWSFLRWVIDQYAPTEAGFLSAMTQQNQVPGEEEIEARTGKSFSQLMAEFSLAFVLDEYPGFTSTDAKYTLPSWNTRNIFAGMNADFSSQGFFLQPIPLKPRPATFGKFTIDVGAVHGGGMSFSEITGTQGVKQLFEFTGAQGSTFPAEMRISIVRVQ